MTGAHGLLGQAVLKLFLKSTNSEILATAKEPRTFLDFGGFDYTMLDITSRSDVKNLVVYFRPDVIINTAAYTNVDGCEQNQTLESHPMFLQQHYLPCLSQLEQTHVECLEPKAKNFQVQAQPF